MYDELMKTFGPRARFHEPMSVHTTFRIGGPADVLVDVVSRDELRTVLEFAREHGVPLHVIGRGANVLVGDDGIRGIVVRLAGEFEGLRFADAPPTASAGAGVPLGALVDETSSRGFANFCWAAGIPGTVGGAVFGNAGSWDRSMGEFVEEVSVMTPDGKEQVLPKSTVRFEYRRAFFPLDRPIVTSVLLRLEEPGATGPPPNRLKATYLARKRGAQPLDLPSAGSVFRNPEGHPAGDLIERAGCKRLHVGDAVVSTKHANFIVNTGGATAADVMSLIAAVQKRVRTRFGVDLELELRVL